MAQKTHLPVVKTVPLATKVIIGGFSGMLTSPLLHPLDVFKVRLQQLPGARSTKLINEMLRNEGIRAPYTGLAAGIMRHVTFTTSRLGIYYCFHEYHKKTHGSLPTFMDKLHYGVYAGLAGALLGCPFEIIFVRMAADGPLDPYKRYTGVVDALNKICSEEGVLNLWRGSILNCMRSVIVTTIQMGTYAMFNDIKNYMVENNLASGFNVYLYISMASSLVGTAVSLPFDTIKTRFQLVNFAHMWDHYLWYRHEAGPAGMWRGFTPYFIRLTVNTLVTFYLMDLIIGNKPYKPKRHYINKG